MTLMDDAREQAYYDLIRRAERLESDALIYFREIRNRERWADEALAEADALRETAAKEYPEFR